MSSHPSSKHPTGAYLAGLSLAALGVVYGDLGTSPLYTLKEVFSEHYGLQPSAPNVLGVLSLIFWALVLVISVKYITFVMRADLKGEGGIMVLTALVTPFRAAAPGGTRTPTLTPSEVHERRGESREHAVRRISRRRRALILLGLFGASLLYGDGMITPSISVLSAIEGLGVATDYFERPGHASLIPLITVVILVVLFAVQKRGTAGLGKVFGPVMLTWFALIASLGLYHIALAPGVLAAVNPLYGVRFFLHNGGAGFWVLGSVMLALTGGEALYADMGHFGVRPIRLAWFTVVLPALTLCYFGQGAMLLSDPAAVSNPFFRLVPGPEWMVYPVVVLATLATIIASQAIISGTFSLTRQAVQLGYLPRLKILQTSSREIGQIYIPSVNAVLLVACVGLVLGFRSSTNLAAAYGVGVTTDMVFTTLLFCVVARTVWRWSLPAVVALGSLFLTIDLAFWGANLIKIPHGGWFPLLVAGAMFTVMTTWEAGRSVMARRMQAGALPLSMFLEDKGVDALARVPGTAVFMGGDPEATPPALLHTVKHIKALHQTVVVLTIRTEEVPHVAPEDRLRVEALPHGFYRAVVSFGFIDEPDVPGALATARVPGLSFAPMETTYFVGRDRVISTHRPSGMARWRERLYSVLSNNARSATAFFDIPANRVVEMGAQIEI